MFLLDEGLHASVNQKAMPTAARFMAGPSMLDRFQATVRQWEVSWSSRLEAGAWG
jgi:hypothetical protein